MARRKAREAGASDAAYHERMAALYRQHILKEKPAAPVIRIQGLGRAKTPIRVAREESEESVTQAV